MLTLLVSLVMPVKREGAASGEIREAMRVAMHVDGAGRVYTAATALRDVIF
ncbi:MAG: hypothetical protein Q6373_010095 [Candidatus Sigynarchaeota archaeon]